MTVGRERGRKGGSEDKLPQGDELPTGGPKAYLVPKGSSRVWSGKVRGGAGSCALDRRKYHLDLTIWREGCLPGQAPGGLERTEV